MTLRQVTKIVGEEYEEQWWEGFAQRRQKGDGFPFLIFLHVYTHSQIHGPQSMVNSFSSKDSGMRQTRVQMPARLLVRSGRQGKPGELLWDWLVPPEEWDQHLGGWLRKLSVKAPISTEALLPCALRVDSSASDCKWDSADQPRWKHLRPPGADTSPLPDKWFYYPIESFRRPAAVHVHGNPIGAHQPSGVWYWNTEFKKKCHLIKSRENKL